jgi:hypothetical protein
MKESIFLFTRFSQAVSPKIVEIGYYLLLLFTFLETFFEKNDSTWYDRLF